MTTRMATIKKTDEISRVDEDIEQLELPNIAGENVR